MWLAHRITTLDVSTTGSVHAGTAQDVACSQDDSHVYLGRKERYECSITNTEPLSQRPVIDLPTVRAARCAFAAILLGSSLQQPRLKSEEKAPRQLYEQASA